MKIEWKFIKLTDSCLSIQSKINNIQYSTVSFKIPEYLVWAWGTGNSKRVANILAKRLKVKAVY